MTATGPSLAGFVAELVGEGAATAAVALVGDGERVEATAAAGVLDEGGHCPCRVTTRFDLASLTKPFTATLAVVLHRDGRLPLDRTLGSLFPGADPRLGSGTVESLLRHRSGLAAWAPLYALAGSPGAVAPLLVGGRFLAGVEERYSDLGYVLYALAAEAATGRAFAELLLGELGADALVEACPAGTDDVAASPLANATEVELAAALGVGVAPAPPRLAGVVNDGNARFLGGLSGHAGLFGPAAALWRLGREWLSPGRLLRPAEVEAALAGGDRYTLGWWRSRADGSAGPALAPAAVGMVGFTGGSLWLDPTRELVAVLLCHRRPGVEMAPWRRRFHELAVEVL